MVLKVIYALLIFVILGAICVSTYFCTFVLDNTGLLIVPTCIGAGILFTTILYKAYTS